MKKNNQKKGFTLVELVIILAIIAIISAVLIPTFAGAGTEEKAGLASDSIFITKANEILKADEEINGKPTTMTEVIDIMKANDLPDYAFKARAKDSKFGWNKATNTMVLIDKNNQVVAPEEFDLVNDDEKYCMVFVNSQDEINKTPGYAYYITDEFADTTIDLPSLVNIESKKSDALTINVNEEAASGNFNMMGNFSAINVVAPEANITVDGTVNAVTGKTNILTLNTPTSKVSLEGTHDFVDAVVGDNSFTVKTNTTIKYLDLKQGNLVINAGSSIKYLNLINDEGAVYKNLSVSLEKGKETEVADSIVNVLANDQKEAIDFLPEQLKVEDKVQVVALINDYSELKTAVETEKSHIKLLKDIHYSTKETIGTGVRPSIYLNNNMVIDFNGKTIATEPLEKNEKITGTACLFEIAEAVEIAILGDGKIDSEAGGNSSLCININHLDATLNVYNCNFACSSEGIRITQGKLNVYGGHFDLTSSRKVANPKSATSMINCVYSSYKDGTAKVNVYGGTYVNFDPSNNPEGKGTTYVAEGYEAVGEPHGKEIWYTVRKKAVDTSKTQA